jgi:hypothetical protein
MAAKSLDEAIEIAMCVGPASEFKERLKYELRDYLAHQVMKLDQYADAIELFNIIFKDVPGIRAK